MSKKMTPCEKLGYKVGDEFEVVEKSYKFDAGDVVCLQNDDGTASPYFTNEIVKDEYPLGVACFLYSVRKVAKLKPAKRALADAIHQNGGWQGGKYAVYGKQSGKCAFLTCRPQYLTKDHGWFVMLSWIAGEFDMKPFVNWHQCILSRDEYFTAYPEQLKVDINNETKHKVEVEMESESEMTINVSDWYKNGELPPVGEVCEAYVGRPPKWIETEIVAHNGGFFIGWCNSLMKACQGNWVDGLRPLRTEREKAIDEMVGEFINHYGDPKGGERYLEIAAKLYNAGYRKEVK